VPDQTGSDLKVGHEIVLRPHYQEQHQHQQQHVQNISHQPTLPNQLQNQLPREHPTQQNGEEQRNKHPQQDLKQKIQTAQQPKISSQGRGRCYRNELPVPVL
jgi:hypothetical protein